MEKIVREKAKKENLLHETRFGAKPVAPQKLHNTTKTPSLSHLVVRRSSVVATMRSPRAGRIPKGVSPRLGGGAGARKASIFSFIFSFV